MINKRIGDRVHERISTIPYRQDIDGLRGIAVLAVVLFHVAPSLLPGGFVGVDIFFVISGYLITSIIFRECSENHFSLSQFYERRIRRIFPAVTVTLTAVFIAAWFLLLPLEFKALGKDMFGGAAFISNLVLMQGADYFATKPKEHLLLHLWSLGVEEQFYLIWPIILVFAHRKHLPIIASIIVLFAGSFAFNMRMLAAHSPDVYYSPFSRFWELLVGCLLALCVTRDRYSDALYQRRFLRSILSLAGLFSLAAGLSFINEATPFPGPWALLPTLGTAAIIAAGPDIWVNKLLIGNPTLRKVGNISFPLYLWHWPILALWTITKGDALVTKDRLLIFTSALLVSWATYRFIERPFRESKKLHRNSFILGICMALIGVTGGVTYLFDGFAQRFTPLVRELVAYKYDASAAYRRRIGFLDADQNPNDFQTWQSIVDARKQTIVLWGDSHAAHLYVGMMARYGSKFNIIERTASLTPPILNFDEPDRPHSREICDTILSEVELHRPAIVILAADWWAYDWVKIEKTLLRLKSDRVQRIVLVGPVPQWREPLPKVLYNCFVNDPLHRIPKRTLYGIQGAVNPIEPAMKKLAEKLQIEYWSVFSVLYDENGCLARLGENGESLIYWDESHLTTTGSDYVINALPAL